MRTLALILLSAWLAAGQSPQPPDCPDAAKPWICGSEEHGCSRTGHKPDAKGHVRHWHKCECQHTCDKGNEETGHRRWDGARCLARCSPSNCACSHPCEKT